MTPAVSLCASSPYGITSERKSGAGRRKEEEWGSVQVNQERASILGELRVRSRFIAKIEKLIWPKGKILLLGTRELLITQLTSTI